MVLGKKVEEDIEIQFTSLREGEKLYVELLNDHERVQITHHPKILIAQVNPNSYHKVRPDWAICRVDRKEQRIRPRSTPEGAGAGVYFELLEIRDAGPGELTRRGGSSFLP